jgi:hypothetical protein
LAGPGREKRPQAVSAAGQKKGIFSLPPDESGRRVVQIVDFGFEIRLESRLRLKHPKVDARQGGNRARACLCKWGRPWPQILSALPF